MTNKKKQIRKGTKKPAAKDNGAAAVESGPSLPPPSANGKNFTNPQLTCLIIVVVGASKLWEFRSALFELSDLSAVDASSANSTDASISSNNSTLCDYYMSTKDDGTDHTAVCRASETLTMMTLRYHSAFQLLALVVYTMLKCWYRDDLLHRLNGFLAMAPISTTLILLQASSQYVTRRPSLILTCICGVLMFLATPGASWTVREVVTFGTKLMPKPNRRTSIQSICLASMICWNLFEALQWFLTNDKNSPILAMPIQWHSAWSVFLYTLMMDKLTISWILTFVWLCFEENRQRTILLAFAILKVVECTAHMSQYDQADFVTDLGAMRTTCVTCAVFCGIAWITPNLHLPDYVPQDDDDECPTLMELPDDAAGSQKNIKVE
ncbi:expressed unknown protein [Seminavis robusta]|uniref:Uncharacterized protein n=1 Tax=Seminavis robusta TaxID=568900 RepID=A0A9N8HBW8_9STRA|nr:expressed unknown protein [Seminavis robusta]|eukprot:Sro275_g105810.1 n/a (381) ;mRNA; r:60002-61144